MVLVTAARTRRYRAQRYHLMEGSDQVQRVKEDSPEKAGGGVREMQA